MQITETVIMIIYLIAMTLMGIFSLHLVSHLFLVFGVNGRIQLVRLQV